MYIHYSSLQFKLLSCNQYPDIVTVFKSTYSQVANLLKLLLNYTYLQVVNVQILLMSSTERTYSQCPNVNLGIQFNICHKWWLWEVLGGLLNKSIKNQ